CSVSWAPGKLFGDRPVGSDRSAAKPERPSVTSSSGHRRVTQEDVDQAGAFLIGPVRERAGSPALESLDRARAGDPRELEAIARRELPRVERLLRRLLGHRADMEDLVQNVFVEMCRALPT